MEMEMEVETEMDRYPSARWRFSMATPITLAAVLVMLVGMMVVPSTAEAVKAYPKVFTRYQPDGTAIAVRMVGDERIVFHETADGYTILRLTDGWWVYADPASAGREALEPSPLRAGIDPVPSGWQRHVRPDIDPAALRIPFDVEHDGSIGELFRAGGFATGADRSRTKRLTETDAVDPTSLAVPVLVILVEFADWTHTSGPGTPLPGEPDYQPIAGWPNTAATWQKLFNDVTVAGGLNHYFEEVSYGQFQWQVTVAANGSGSGHGDGSGTGNGRGNGAGMLVNDGWYVNPETMAFWGEDKLEGSYCDTDADNEHIYNLVVWAIRAADADVDYSAYDSDGNGMITDAELMVFVVHARPGQEYYGDDCWGADPQHHIWSHQWSLHTKVETDDGVAFPGSHSYSLNPEFEPGLDTTTDPWSVVDKWFGVGVYAHEALHTLGAPDLYDYGYDANVAGEWDLMDGGSFNGAKAGTHPSHMGAPLKIDLELRGSADSYGWIFEEDVTDLVDGSDHVEGGYRIDGLGGDSHTNVLHRVIAPNDPGEWFVLENRAPVGYYDPFLPEFGLLVWHRDLDGTRDNWPYRAAVERPGWANTAEGLNTSTAAAAMSLDDDATLFTSFSDPDNTLNNETVSGVLDILCVGAESSSVPYVYGHLTGPDIDYAGSTVTDPIGDDDGFIDNGETVAMAVRVGNTGCATESASDVTLGLAVDGSSDIPASAVMITPATVSLGTIAAGGTVEHGFTVTLACDPDGYTDRSITFRYSLTGTNFDPTSGTFSKVTDRDYLFVDDMEMNQMGALWSGTTLRAVSVCSDAEGHGEWIWSSDRAHSGGFSYHTPEEIDDVSYSNPEESLVGPNIPVPAGVALKELSFWHASEIPCPGFTRARVWISTNGGVSWSRVESFYRDGGDLEWEQTRINLAGYAGAAQLQFKFVMYTYECWSTCVGTEGWYIDDVQVVSDETTTCGE